jgi:hypothetical protein
MHFISRPFIILWFSWFATELIMNSDDPLSVLFPCIAGAIVCEIYGIRSYLRACQSANDIVRQINELGE